MFGAFLKVKDHCEVCGEELHHHRADDFPAYVVILIVGHLLVPAVLSVETNFAPPAVLGALGAVAAAHPSFSPSACCSRSKAPSLRCR